MTKKRRNLYITLAVAAVLAIALALLALTHSSNNKKYLSYYDDGQQYYEIQDYNSAIFYLEKAVSIKPADEAVIMLADCYVATDSTDKAIELLEKYSKKSNAVEKKLREIKNGVVIETNDIVIGNETYSPDTTSVGLSGKGITSQDIKDISLLTELKSATLSKNRLTDISALSNLGKLEVLDLSENEIEDISPLSSLRSLRTLYLDENEIKDFSPLYKLSKLSTLSIKNIDITEKQLKELQDALPDCRIHSEKAKEDIEDISLGGVTFKSNVTELDLSGKKIADISPLIQCENLTKLDLRNNNISDLSPLMDIPGLQWLCIKNNNVSDMRPLMGLTRLTYLDAQGNNISSLSSIGSLSNVVYLYLGNNPVGNFSPVSLCTNLQELGLENTGLEDSDLSNLSQLKNLKKLYIENNNELTVSAVNALKAELPSCKISHSTLKNEVTLGESKFAVDATSVNASNLGLVDISPVSEFTSCQTLLLSDNKISNLTPLAKLVSVKTLDLSDNKITDISPLKTMTGLHSLNLEGNSISNISDFQGMTWLRELYISSNGLTQEQIASLYEMLPDCVVVVDGQTQ